MKRDDARSGWNIRGIVEDYVVDCLMAPDGDYGLYTRSWCYSHTRRFVGGLIESYKINGAYNNDVRNASLSYIPI